MRKQFQFPIFEVAHGILANNGDFSLGFELSLPPTGSISALEYDQALEAKTKALNSFEAGTILHWMDWFTRAKYLGDPVSDDFLIESSEKHFDSRPYLHHRCFVFIGCKKSLKPEMMQEHGERCAQWAHILEKEGGITTRRLPKEELETIIEQYCHLHTGPEMLSCDVKLEDRIQIGNKTGIFYSLSNAEDLPQHCSSSIRYEPYSTDVTDYPIGFASAVGPLLNVEHIYHQLIQIADPATVVPRLEKQKQRAGSMSLSRENAATAQAIDAFLGDAAQRQQKMVRAHFNVFAWTDNAEHIPELKRQVATAIGKLGATAHLETITAPELWLSCMPGNAGSLPGWGWFDCFAAQACCFLSAESNRHISNPGFGVRLGERLTGIPRLVDLSDEPWLRGWIDNRNKTVIGGSGSGKSFYLNSFVHWYLHGESHVMIIDIGGSYRRLCELMGGYYSTYEESAPICFNPFRLDNESYPSIEKVESLKVLLITLWKKESDEVTQPEYLTLSKAIKGYYQWLYLNQGIQPCFNTYYEYLKDVFTMQLKEEKGDHLFDIGSLLYVLRPFYRGGEYDYLLNAENQPAFLQHPFLVFELDTIADHPILYPVVTIIIMQTFIAKLRSLKGVRKVLLIEEAWKPLLRPSTSGYIKWLFKTARKFFGEIIVATQDIDDLIGNTVVKNTIINNADCKIFTDCRKFQNRFHELQELFGLTEKDKIQALSLNKANDPQFNYKEVFVSMAKGPSNVYRNEVSLEEYLLFTTEQKEQVKVGSFLAKIGSLPEAIAALAADIRSGAVQLLLTAVFLLSFLIAPQARASAQLGELISAVVKKALVSADLEVQKQQTNTIALQTAQKQAETNMQNGLLSDISSWVQQQQALFSTYYQQLWEVKSAISSLGKVEWLIQRQAQLIIDCAHDWSAVQQDKHFSLSELSYIGKVYQAILEESNRNVRQLAIVIQSLFTQMDDAGRLQLVDAVGRRIESNYGALRRWTDQNALLSSQRARSQADLQTIQILYGLP